MSSRPSGPSSRPIGHFPIARHSHMYTPLLPGNIQFNGHEPPRLKERNVMFRIVYCLLLVVCTFGLVFAVHALIQNTYGNLTNMSSIFHEQTRGTSWASVPNAKRLALKKSIVQKMAMLKRSANGNGVDLMWTRQLFPHWFVTQSSADADSKNVPTFDVQSTLSDILLAMSFLTQAELSELPKQHES